MSEVYLNGKFVGCISKGKEFASNIIDDRRKGDIARNINVRYDNESDEVRIDASRGRLRRALIVIKEGKPLLNPKHVEQLGKGEITWFDLLQQGIIEYLDASEEENALVAYDESQLTEEHTHLEIHPVAMNGIIASLVPYGNYSPGARLSMGAKNQKQGIGLYALNHNLRMDMDVNILHYPQRPIVQTIMHDTIRYDDHPCGQNFVVAVMSYEGYNLEDAIIINKGSIERGLARSTYYRPSTAEEIRYSGGLVDEISIPDKDVKGYRSENAYSLLEEDGIAYPEAKIAEEEVVIGRTSPPRFLSSFDEYNLVAGSRRESSIALDHGVKGVVDFVLLTESNEGNKLVQVRLRDQRIPEIGDKFTARSGQKGVIGMLVPQADLPFSETGIVPDLIFSPHGIPSRMTISFMIELIGGKVGALSGRQIDGTTFSSEPESDLRKELLDMGFSEGGTETLYDGKTGRRIEAKIFIGNMYYLRLKHMVANKIHSRARGPIQLLTRQPTEGRAKKGGLRLGEMEKDTFVAHGASLLLKERFDSDKTIVPVCEGCGMIAVKDEFRNRRYCTLCGDDSNISDIEMSYAFKLLLEEVKSLLIYPKLKLKTRY